MEHFICELPVRLSETGAGSESTGECLSSTALHASVDMMGGAKALQAKVSEIAEAWKTQKHVQDSSETSTFAFSLCPENPFSSPIHAIRDDVEEESIYLYNQSTNTIENGSVVGVYRFNTMAPFEIMAASTAMPQWQNVLQPPEGASSEIEPDKPQQQHGSAVAPLRSQPLPVYVGVWSNIPRELQSSVTREGSSNSSSNMAELSKNERKITRHKTNVGFELVGSLPSPSKSSISLKLRAGPERQVVAKCLRQLFDECPIMLRRKLECRLKELTSKYSIKRYGTSLVNDEIRKLAFFYQTGPWQKCFVKFGYDPRKAGAARNESNSGVQSTASASLESAPPSQASSWPIPGILQIIDQRQSREHADRIWQLLASCSQEDRESTAGKIISALVESSLVQLSTILDIYPGLVEYVDKHVTFRKECASDGWLDKENLDKIKLVLSYFLRQAVVCMTMSMSRKSPEQEKNESTSSLANMDIVSMPSEDALNAHADREYQRKESRKRLRTRAASLQHRQKVAKVKESAVSDTFDFHEVSDSESEEDEYAQWGEEAFDSDSVNSDDEGGMYNLNSEADAGVLV